MPRFEVRRRWLPVCCTWSTLPSSAENAEKITVPSRVDLIDSSSESSDADQARAAVDAGLKAHAADRLPRAAKRYEEALALAGDEPDDLQGDAGRVDHLIADVLGEGGVPAGEQGGDAAQGVAALLGVVLLILEIKVTSFGVEMENSASELVDYFIKNEARSRARRLDGARCRGTTAPRTPSRFSRRAT